MNIFTGLMLLGAAALCRLIWVAVTAKDTSYAPAECPLCHRLIPEGFKVEGIDGVDVATCPACKGSWPLED